MCIRDSSLTVQQFCFKRNVLFFLHNAADDRQRDCGSYPRRWLHLSLYRLKGKLRTAGVRAPGTLAVPGCGEETIRSPAHGPAPAGRPPSSPCHLSAATKRYMSFCCQHELPAVESFVWVQDPSQSTGRQVAFHLQYSSSTLTNKNLSIFGA